jgi:pSer/pThr/pTyr-binding forkhead associated (FHA) protein
MECFLQFSGTERDQLISRYHCQLDVDVDPPGLRVQDLGSRNGTFVNARPIIPRLADTADDSHPESQGCDLIDGDLLTVGGTTLRVNVVDCPHVNDTASGWEEGMTAKRDCALSC